MGENFIQFQNKRKPLDILKKCYFICSEEVSVIAVNLRLRPLVIIFSHINLNKPDITISLIQSQQKLMQSNRKYAYAPTLL